MKKITSLLLLVAFFVGVNLAHAEGKIFLEAHNESVHKIGNKIKLEWTSQNIPSSKTLAIYISSLEKGFLYPIKGKLKLNGSYTWKIPKGTSPATDYQFSMSTEDKGPSAGSENTSKFEIVGNEKDSQSIKAFDIKVSSKENGTGKIALKMKRNNGTRLGLNLSCSEDEVWVEVKGTEIGCKEWIYFSEKNAKATLNYSNLTNEEQKVYFTLDLYDASGKLLQRQFKDATVPSEIE